MSLVRPFVGLLIFVCFAILRPESLWHWSVPEGNYSRIIAIALLVGWLLNGLGDWQLGRAKALALLIVGFWIWVVLGVSQSLDREVAWARVDGMSKIYLPFLVGLTMLNSVARVKQLAWVIVLSQGYLALHFNLDYLNGQFNPLEFDHGSLDNNGMAITMVACAGFAFFLGMHAEHWWQKGVAYSCALLIGHFVLFSMSRGGMLALVCTGTFAFFLIPKTAKHYLAFAVGIALMVRLAGPEVLARFETVFVAGENRDRAADSR
ncbi:MAG: DUF5935 domain-containing protein, partial [Acidobacteriales bacterium]|nr:DUF5935 domain-containing protein [Terriglobales bacterium]